MRTRRGSPSGTDAVWVVESGGPSVSRISPDTNVRSSRPIEVGNGPAGIAVGEGDVWVTNRFDGTISRIDPDSGRGRRDDPGRARPARDRGRVRQRVGGAGRVEHGGAHRPRDERGDAADRRGQRAGVAGRERGRRVGREHARRHRLADQPRHELGRRTRSRSGTAPRGSRSWTGPCGWRTKRTGRSRGSSPVRSSARTMVIGSVPQGLAGVNGDLWVSVRGTATSHRGGTLRLVSAISARVARPGGHATTPLRGACCTCSGTVSSRSSRSVGATPRSCPTWPHPYRRRPTAVERTPSSCARGSDTRTVRSSRPPTSAVPSNGSSALERAQRTSSAGSSGARRARTSLERVTSPRAS